MPTINRGRFGTRALWVLSLCVLLSIAVWFLGYEEPAGTGKVGVTLLVNPAGGRPIRHTVYLEAPTGVTLEHLLRQAKDDCLGKGPDELVFTSGRIERKFNVLTLRRWRRWHIERCVDRTARWIHHRLGEIGLAKVKFMILRWNNRRIEKYRDWKEIYVEGDDMKVLPGDSILAVAEKE